MSDLAQIIKTAMVTSRGCCHEPLGQTCTSCMAQHIADVVAHEQEGDK